jgi:hypothetical protein
LASTETSAGPTARPAGSTAGRRKLMLLLAVFAAPVVASYLFYFAFPPAGRVNYGDLIDPQRPVPTLELATLGGERFPVDSLKGQWVLLHVDHGACDTACVEKLFTVRQLRTMTGKDRTRIERAWLITDDAAVDPRLLAAYDGTLMLRGGRDDFARWLPVPDGARVEDFLYLVDPLGNLMMRFPRDGDPGKVHKDIARLLKASRVG